MFTAPLVDGGVERKQFFNPVLLYGLSINTEQADLAHDWISYVVSKEGQETMLEASGQFPNRADVDVAAVAQQPRRELPSRPSSTRSAACPSAQINSTRPCSARPTQNITQAAIDGDIQGFLDNLESLQSS